MSTTQDRVLQVLHMILEDKGISDIPSITEDKLLYDGGLGLDSLDTAAFSAGLETEFGYDPYFEGHLVMTVGEVIEYYRAREAV